MGKKYSPSGYQIIDLTGLGNLESGEEYSLDVNEDTEVFKECLNKMLLSGKLDIKPIILKVLWDDCLHIGIPHIYIGDDGLITLTLVSGNSCYIIDSNLPAPNVTSIRLQYRELVVAE